MEEHTSDYCWIRNEFKNWVFRVANSRASPFDLIYKSQVAKWWINSGGQQRNNKSNTTLAVQASWDLFSSSKETCTDRRNCNLLQSFRMIRLTHNCGPTQVRESGRVVSAEFATWAASTNQTLIKQTKEFSLDCHPGPRPNPAQLFYCQSWKSSYRRLKSLSRSGFIIAFTKSKKVNWMNESERPR